MVSAAIKAHDSKLNLSSKLDGKKKNAKSESGSDNIHGFVLAKEILSTRIGYCSNTSCAHRFRCEVDNKVGFAHVQPHYYRLVAN